MAKSSEDALGELYGFDSTIDEMYERGVDHAAFDEDEALEAYEEIIQVGSAADSQPGDSVLSLAAQLLTKHFAKFPHVHLNVVDVLLALCAAFRPQAVRIHSVRSLLQIVKSGHAPPLALACRTRIGEDVAALLQSEPSNVLVRHLTQLQDALVALNEDMKKQEKKEKWAEAKLKKQAIKKEKQEKEKLEKQERLEKEKVKAEKDAADRKNKRDAERTRENDKDKRREEPIRDADRRRENNDREVVERQAQNQQTPDKRQNGKPNEDASEGRERARDSGKSTNGNGHTPPGCPPSRYIFVGGVPRDSSNRDIINFLSCIDESLDYSCVQIKMPSHRNGAGYAFVSLESTDHARKAIRHIETTEYNGRKLIGDFARGPPCGTLQFVQRNSERRMLDVDAFPLVDYSTLDASIWDELHSKLQRYGPVEVLRVGRVRFRDVENAKEVIRLPCIRVQGREFWPIYDPEEQELIDSSKRRPRSSSGAEVGRERRGSGDLSRYGGPPADRRAVDRRDSRDFKRKSPPNGVRDDKRPRSVSTDRRDSRDKFAPQEKPERRHSDSNQSRYGPRETTTSAKVNARDARERSPIARRMSINASPRRSRSRSPLQRNAGDRGSNERGRSRSPVARRQSEDGRKRGDDRGPRAENLPPPSRVANPVRNSPASNERYRSRSPVVRRPSDEGRKRREGRDDGRGPRAEDAQLQVHGGDSVRNSPAGRGRQDSPPRRGSFEGRRSRSPVSRREQFERKYGRPASDNVPAPPRGRSRSPRRMASPPPVKDSSRREENGRHEELKRPRSRSHSPPRDEPPPQRRTSGDAPRPGMPHEDDERLQAIKQQGEREFERERPRGRREKEAPKMSKYGTVKGGDPSSRSPPPAQGRSERSRSRDGNKPTPGRGEDRPQRRGSDSGQNRNGFDARDRRSSPPRRGADDRNDRNDRDDRVGSPPRSPHAPSSRDRPGDHRSPPRNRSPPRVIGQKRERSRSPQRKQTPAGGDRRSRLDGRDVGRDQEQRQPNRTNSPDRRRPKTEERARDKEKVERQPARGPENNPRKDMRDPTRGRADERRQDERPKPDTRRSQSPLRRDQRKRSASPVPSPQAKKSNAVTAAVETKPKHESPRAVTQSSKTTTNASIYDIDECMVDYEEDDD